MGPMMACEGYKYAVRLQYNIYPLIKIYNLLFSTYRRLHAESFATYSYNQGRIDPPKAGRGHATPIQPVQRAKCWRLPRFEWYHVRARHNALIYRPYKETADVFLVTASISPPVLAVWELHALSPPSVGRYALAIMDSRVCGITNHLSF